MCIEWARDWHSRLGKYAGAGVYVNFLSADQGENRLRAAYGENARRLAAIKSRYDPENFFRRNQNIAPKVWDRSEEADPERSGGHV